MHPPDVTVRDFICLTLDHAQMGVGGDDSWGARVHPEYTLPAKDYAYRFVLRPLEPGEIPRPRPRRPAKPGGTNPARREYSLMSLILAI